MPLDLPVLASLLSGRRVGLVSVDALDDVLVSYLDAAGLLEADALAPSLATKKVQGLSLEEHDLLIHRLGAGATETRKILEQLRGLKPEDQTASNLYPAPISAIMPIGRRGHSGLMEYRELMARLNACSLNTARLEALLAPQMIKLSLMGYFNSRHADARSNPFPIDGAEGGENLLNRLERLQAALANRLEIANAVRRQDGNRNTSRLGIMMELGRIYIELRKEQMEIEDLSYATNATFVRFVTTVFNQLFPEEPVTENSIAAAWKRYLNSNLVEPRAAAAE